MVEITSLEQAIGFHKTLFTYPEHLSERALGITNSMMGNGNGNGHLCPHFGGDYWLVIRQGSEKFFCNIPPGPLSFPDSFYYSVLPSERQVYETVLKFLEKRNEFLGHAVAFFEERQNGRSPH